MNLRESVGRAVNSSHLQWSAHKSGDIDLVAAMGLAGVVSPLGAAFYRLYVGQDTGSLGDVLALLAPLVPARGLQHSERHATAKQAVTEMLWPQCRRCEGRGLTFSARGVAATCAACDGLALGRYSDSARARGIGVDEAVYRRKFEAPLTSALGVMTAEIAAVDRALKNKLALVTSAWIIDTSAPAGA